MIAANRLRVWVTVLLLIGFATPASAVWHHPREVFHGTAHVLEQGEIVVGIVTPVIYGATDDLSVSLHPILWALLTPNANIRYRVIEGDSLQVSLILDTAGTVLEDRGALPDDRPIAHVYGGAAATFHVGAGVLLTVQAGYQHEWGQLDSKGLAFSDDAFAFGGSVNWLIAPNHLLLTGVGAQYSGQLRQIEDLTGSITYAYAFDSGSRLGVGVAFGTFPLRVDSGADGKEINLPAWPVIDWWARF